MAVPNTSIFNLQDVQTELGGINDDLIECFASANAGGFDPLYEGSKNGLLNFRNYSHGISSPPVYESEDYNSNGLTNTLTFTHPTGTVVNDILVAFIGDVDADTITPPAGWTHEVSDFTNGNLSGGMWWRRFDGTEPASIVFTSASAAGPIMFGTMVRFSNCITVGSPFGTAPALYPAANIGSVTGTTTGAFNQVKVQALLASSAGTYTDTSDADWTQHSQWVNTSGGRLIILTSDNTGGTSVRYSWANTWMIRITFTLKSV